MGIKGIPRKFLDTNELFLVFQKLQLLIMIISLILILLVFSLYAAPIYRRSDIEETGAEFSARAAIEAAIKLIEVNGELARIAREVAHDLALSTKVAALRFDVSFNGIVSQRPDLT